MLAPNETVQHLQAARNLIATCYKGTFRHNPKDEGACALEALIIATGRDPWQVHWSNAPIPDSLVAAAKTIIAESSYICSPDPIAEVTLVNDTFGQSAALRMFDLAIQNELAATGEP